MWRKKRREIAEEDRVVKDEERAYSKTMTRAVNLLAARPRAVEELRTRLLEKPWTNDKIVARVLSKLTEYGYLDDEQYAKNAALSAVRQRPQGRHKLRQVLARKPLDREIKEKALEHAFEQIPESDLIDTVIERRLRLKGMPQVPEEFKKFYDHLLRKGFSYDLIREKMAAIKGGEFPFD
ncbi:MAG: regulatory protein RecX [Acidobacteria bacterium OLB17]|nr:MAG: regulatory protein RecX [Acidobacteria bacterium OLB17]MCZ2390813.1 RecX family transcriptional regulator [Acidobacteriota bacterium]